MVRCLAVILPLLGCFLQCFGDGKTYYFHREDVPPEIPYQRAFIHHKDGLETLILQSKYEVTPQEGHDQIAWVVPVPGFPEIGSMSASDAQTFFRRLGRMTPDDIFIVEELIDGVMFLLVLLWPTFLYLYKVKKYPLGGKGITREELKRNYQRRDGSLIQWVFLTFLMFILSGLGMTGGATMSADSRVLILDERKVGIYNVKVIKSKTSEALLDWLEEGGFQFSEVDKSAFEEHIQEGWCFVVAKSDLTADGRAAVAEGLFAPLILKFAAPFPIYPLALTATAGQETEILLYLLTDVQYRCGDRLKLRYVSEKLGGRTFDDYMYGKLFE